MSISKKQSKILWKEGPTTMAFVTHTLPFFQQTRFKINSIYPIPQIKHLRKNRKKLSKIQQVAETISKSIDTQQKNERRMQSYKKQKSGSLSKPKQHHKNKSYGSMPDSTSIHINSTINTARQTDQMMTRLFVTTNVKMSKLRDRNGLRRQFFANEEDQVETKLQDNSKFLQKCKGFSTTKRIDLKLPETYYPGPGAYSVKRQFEDKGIYHLKRQLTK